MEDKQYQIDLLTAMNERLMNSEHVYRLACEFTGAAYIYYDLRNEQRVELFGAWEALTGEILSRQPYDERFMLSQIHDDDVKKVREHLLNANMITTSRDAIEFRSKHGNKWVKGSMCIVYDNNGKPMEKLLSFQDVTRNHTRLEEIEYYAFHDVLTGLYNRNHFFTVFREMLVRASKENTCVEFMLVDIDNFKKINDHHGLVYGDELVAELAAFIKGLANDKIKVGRYGSDVFAVAIYDPQGKNCSDMIFKAIRDRLKKPFVLSNSAEIFISVSAGVTEYPGGGTEALELIKNAEIVLYVAKQKEKGTITYYTDEILKHYRDALTLEKRLTDAIANKEFSVYFQPLYDSGTGKMRGAEALLRWLDADGRVVYNPDEFIPVAEKNGSIIELGNFVFSEVFRSIHDWIVKYRAEYIISINVSALQLEKPDFIDNIVRLMEHYEVDASYIELEITESVLISNFNSVLDTIKQLNQLGIKVSLDDFGTGFSSLSYLRELPINTLKIDKSFIDNICCDDKTADITSAVVNMVKKLNLETVAEGVESEEQLEYLKSIGCDNIQGFLFSKPVNKTDFEKCIIRQMP